MSDLHPQTGPTTIEGKARSSQNALTFGFTSRKLLVGDERQEDYNALLDDLRAEFGPETAHARGLVEDAAHARWMLWRKQRAYNAVEAGIYETEPDEAHWTEQIFQRLHLADRYRTNAERAFKRAMTNVELLRRHTLSEEQRAARERHWQLRFEQTERSLQLREGKGAAERQKEQEEIDAAEHDKVYAGFDEPTLVQQITVCPDGYGDIMTLKVPTNDMILRWLDTPGKYTYLQVCREFTFEDGIPPEYDWIKDSEKYRTHKGHTWYQLCGVDVFRDIYQQETTLEHAVVGRPMNTRFPPRKLVR